MRERYYNNWRSGWFGFAYCVPCREVPIHPWKKYGDENPRLILLPFNCRGEKIQGVDGGALIRVSDPEVNDIYYIHYTGGHPGNRWIEECIRGAREGDWRNYFGGSRHQRINRQ